MKKDIEFPESWDEISGKKMSGILKIATIHKNLPLETARIAIAKLLLDVRRPDPFHPDKFDQYFVLVKQLADNLNWMFRDTEYGWALNYTYPINILPRINNLYGPAGAATDMTFGEFRDALSAFSNYQSCRDILDLYRLFGILYRKPKRKSQISAKNFNGNYREQYNKNLMPLYLKVGFKQKEAHLLWAYIWFGAFASYLFSGGEFYLQGENGPTISFAPIFSGGDHREKNYNNIGMDSIIFSIAEEGAMGDIKNVEDTNLFTVLLKLMHDYHKSEEIKKSMNI